METMFYFVVFCCCCCCCLLLLLLLVVVVVGGGGGGGAGAGAGAVPVAVIVFAAHLIFTSLWAFKNCQIGGVFALFDASRGKQTANTDVFGALEAQNLCNYGVFGPD